MSGSREKVSHQIIDALFQDIPGELDRLFRESEFASNRLFDQPRSAAEPNDVARTARQFHPSVLLGTATLALLFFGPTLGSLCTALGQTVLLIFIALICALGLIVLVRNLPRLFGWWTAFPDDAEIDPTLRTRRFVVRLLLVIGSVLPLALLIFTGFSVWQTISLYDTGLCVDTSGPRTASLVQLGAFIAFAAVLAFAHRRNRPLQQSSVGYVAGLFAAAAIVQLLIVFLLADGETREAQHTPYLHVFTFGVLALLLIALAARFLAKRLFRPAVGHAAGDALQQAARNTEFFQVRKDNIPSDSHILDAFFRSLYGGPALLLLPACLAAMIAAPAWVPQSFFGGLLVALLLSTWSRLNSRWNTIFSLVRRWFFVGWPTAISYLVILIGLARFAGVSYVTTIVDSAPLGFLPVLIVLGYSSLWFFEYWINREVGKQYLCALGASAEADDMNYECQRREGLTLVKIAPRWLQLHGTGRLAVVGYYQRDDETRLAWHTYTYSNFLERLRARITDLDADDATVRASANSVIDDMRRRTALYFSIINSAIAIVVLAVVAVGLQANNTLSREPVAVGTEWALDDARRYSLAGRLAEQCADTVDGCDEVVALAASGGGSRAAMHTVAVLRALAAEQKAANVVLVSGVSGGGASLGYFAAHHDALMRGYPSGDWECFANAMSTPFIQQVVESVGEVRMLRRTTVAHTLAESLEQQYFNGDCETVDATHVVDVDRLGLVLNTTVAGHPAALSPVGARLFGKSDAPSTETAGARLAFTNLAELSAFATYDVQGHPGTAPYDGAVALPYRLVTADGITLAEAAALNANFPPVFPNSEVRLTSRHGSTDITERFFVTDGGVTENRGVLSLLLALQSAVNELEQSTPSAGARFPDIRIVVADAGSLSYSYSADRGIGTAVSGGPQALIANAWLATLLDDVSNRYASLTGARVYVDARPMPAALRLSGAIGTHWMLPATVYLQNPRTALDDSDDASYVVDRKQAICLVLQSQYGDLANCLSQLNPTQAAEILQLFDRS